MSGMARHPRIRARRDLTVSDSVVIATDARTLWQAVADPSQMPRWSPENTRGYVPEAGRTLDVGESFVGANRRGRARWQTRCVVTASEPGLRFAFDVVQIGVRRPRISAPIASWAYDFVSHDEHGGPGIAPSTTVTETWTDARHGWPDPVANTFDRIVTRGQPFAAFQRRNIARTLASMKADFESASGA